MKFFFISSDSSEALSSKKKLMDVYGQNSVEKADVIIPLGGDGFLLRCLHNFNKFNKPFYGINYGSIGFLMNSDYYEKLDKIKKSIIKNLTSGFYPERQITNLWKSKPKGLSLFKNISRKSIYNSRLINGTNRNL